MLLKNKILLAASTLLVLLAGALGYAISPAATPAWAAVMAGLALLLPVAIVWPVGGLFGAVFLRHSLDAFSNFKVTLPFINIDLNLAAGLAILILCSCLIYFLNSNHSFKNIPLFKYWLLFLVAISLSLPLAQSPLLAIQEWLKVIVAFCLFVVGAFYFGLKERREWLEKLILWALIIPIIIALYQIVTSSGLIGFYLPSRAYGTYGHPNVLAFNLVIWIGIIFYLWRTQYRNSKWPILFIAVGLITLLFTYTRAGYLGLAVFALVLGLLEYRTLTLKICLIGGLIVALFFPINNWLKENYNYDLQDNPLISRLTQQEEDFNSLDWRQTLWQQSLGKIKQHPILGWGYGMFGAVLNSDRNDIDPPEAHNDYLRLLVETGGAGLGSYLLLQAMVAWSLFQSWRKYEKRSLQKLQCAILLGLFITLLIESLSDNLLHATALQYSWMLLLGAALSEPWKLKKPSQ